MSTPGKKRKERLADRVTKLPDERLQDEVRELPGPPLPSGGTPAKKGTGPVPKIPDSDASAPTPLPRQELRDELTGTPVYKKKLRGHVDQLMDSLTRVRKQ